MTIWDRFIDLIRSLFQGGRKPGASAYGYLYASLKENLKREGVKVGGTAGMPRVEIHSITEQARLDKAGDVRQVSFSVESLHNRSLEECTLVADGNVAILTSLEPYEIATEAIWVRVLGFVPDQRQDMTETSDTDKIVYRIIDTFTAWVEAHSIDPGPVDPDPGGPEPDNP